ncbi:Exocyst complex component Sec10 family protein [Leishmania donovani]|uniref:Exocyst complex component Sec10 family protein n=1 Tax=Leishmania donovani TaxID=5661 RepID=A0A504XRU3_LEIDO|nr:Exocyst complex component Sec10 family protein [Leishmania donovani]
MDRDMNEQSRRQRRVLRSAAARQQRQDDSGHRETEVAAAPSVRLAPSVTGAQGPAPVARAPAPRLVGPPSMPGTSPSAAGAATPRESRSDLQASAVAPRGSSGGGAAPSTACNNSSSSAASGAATAASSLEPTPAMVSTSSTAEAAMESAVAGRRMMVDRTLFSTIAFSSPLFVNNISQRLLYPVLQRHRAEQKRFLTTGGPGSRDGSSGGAGGARGGGSAVAGTHVDSEAAQLLGSDGTPLQLTSTLEEASEEVRRLLEEEETLLHREEVRCKRVEIREKRRLATVRLGLEGTSARLQLYENRVSNAQAATAGIEQHLAHSNARVQRGKAVSQLLRYFKMMTSISSNELRALLESISATRKTQRAAVTTRWAAGRVSAFRPRFYTTVISTAAPASATKRYGLGSTASSVTTRTVLTSSRSAGVGAGSEGDDGSSMAKRSASATAVAPDADAAPARTTRRPRVFRSGARRRSPAASSDASPPSQARSLSPQQSPQRSPRAAAGKDMPGDDDDNAVRMQGAVGGNAVAEHDEDEREEAGNDDEAAAAMEDGGDGTDGDAIVDLTQVRMQRAEAAAVAAGLDRLFALRFCTEAQVEWCQRLTLLANELGDLATNAKNVRIYVDWLRKELVSDLFHVVTCFNDFYNEHPQTAVYQAYGRALLKTLGRISSLYNTLTASNDELLSLFFSRSINDLGVALFSEWSPKPLPGLPPLPQSSEVRAMDHYRQHTDKELQRTFRFLLDRIRRNVVVVETIFGTTNTARQQLLSRVTDGVVRPFLSQQIKLAETQATSMMQAEGSLTPRTKRRCGARVADSIAYHHTMETRLYAFYQEYVRELRNIFSANQVDFLGRFVDVIFAQRGAYSAQRTELELLNRYFTLIEEKYTRSLHAIPDEFFDLREAHMTKMKEVLTCLTEVAGRVKTYALPKEVGSYVYDLIKATLVYVGNYLDAELRKVSDSLRNDRDNWRVKPKSEDELLQPLKMEPQQCAIRMLLFAQSSLMTLSDTTDAICVPLLQQYPRLIQDVEEARSTALEAVDERSERLLNMCVQAILLRSLSILQHYQLKSDYLPKADSKRDDADTVAPPCTRACTLFCYYITRQFDMASEFIRLSNGQIHQRQMSSQTAAGGALGAAVQQHQAARAAATDVVSGTGGTTPVLESVMPSSTNGAFTASPASSVSAVRARARTMNLQQLLYGDGGPSSFVRTLGVCLYRGISAHLKSFVANDRGALVYKQDVTAYKEAMAPLTSTPGLGGAVVEVLFQMLKETSSLLIMPLDHIREVKESGYLKLMSAEEKLRYLRIRQDVRSAMKIIFQ